MVGLDGQITAGIYLHRKLCMHGLGFPGTIETSRCDWRRKSGLSSANQTDWRDPNLEINRGNKTRDEKKKMKKDFGN